MVRQINSAAIARDKIELRADRWAQVLQRVVRIGSMRVLAAAIAFGSTIVLTNLMGAHEFGWYALFGSAIVIMSGFGKWGWDGAGVRFVAGYCSNDEAGLAKAFSVHAVRKVLGLSALTAVAVGSGYVVARVWLGFATAVPFWLAGAVVLLLPVLTLSLLAQGLLRGQGRQLHAELFEGLLKPLLVVVLASMSALALTRVSAPVAVGAYACATLMAAAFGLWLVSSYWRSVEAGRPDDAQIQEWRLATRMHGLVNLCQSILAKSPMVIAGLLLSPLDAGLLAVAMRVAESLQIGLTAVGLSAAPRIAALYFQNRRAELADLTRKATWVSAAIGVGGAFVLGSGATHVLGIFGTEFLEISGELKILLVAQVFSALVGPAGYLVTMTGHQKIAAKIYSITAAFSVVAIAVAANVWGTTGVAIAYVVCLMVQNGMVWRLSRHVLQNDALQDRIK